MICFCYIAKKHFFFLEKSSDIFRKCWAWIFGNGQQSFQNFNRIFQIFGISSENSKLRKPSDTVEKVSRKLSENILPHQARRQGGCNGCERTPPPYPHGPKRSAWKDPKMNLRKKKERQRWIFSSNLKMHAALHSVENLPEVVYHLKLCSWYWFIYRDQSIVIIR